MKNFIKTVCISAGVYATIKLVEPKCEKLICRIGRVKSDWVYGNAMLHHIDMKTDRMSDMIDNIAGALVCMNTAMEEPSKQTKSEKPKTRGTTTKKTMPKNTEPETEC